MTVFKINKTNDYTVMSNYHLREKQMSLKAKGLLSLMLSLPSSWDYSINGIVAICKENESAINSTLKELKEFGYLKVDKLMPNKTQSGRIEYVYNIFEKPQQKQDAQKQALENQPLVIQPLENQAQLNTNNQLIKKLNNNNNNIIVLDYLNQKSGTHYKAIESNLKFINARLKDYSIEDLKAVIDKKVAEWKGTPMQKYLRPETLFNATKFESYLNGLENIKEKTADFQQREYTKEQLNDLYDNLDDTEI